MASFTKANAIPESVVGAEGTAKRNILRKGEPSKARKEKATGQIPDDGSLSYAPAALDTHDPNYDSEEEIGNEYIPLASTLRALVERSKITLTEYKRKIEPLISEYFIHSEFDEILQSLQEIGAPEYAYEFVKRSMNMSFDKGDRERELVSKLFSVGYPDMLSSNMIGKGFERLFEMIDEIEKDVPTAREKLSIFLARAVVDEVLPPSFLADPVVCNLGGDIVVQAKVMLSRDHGGAQLERVWGPGDGRPVEELKVAVDMLLQEYLLSGDITEACRCIHELGAPQFGHEILKRAVVLSLDKTPEQRQQTSRLLAFLVEQGELSEQQAAKGFDKLYTILDDLVLDTPTAAEVVADFNAAAKGDKVLLGGYQPPAKVAAV